MKVNMPMMSVEARGSISGVEFRVGPYGQVAGRKSTATYQSTPAQQQARGRLVLAHRAWEALTDATQSAWNAHATYPSTGRNTYIAMWVRFTQAEQAPIVEPAIEREIDQLLDLQVSTDILLPNELRVDWKPNPAACTLLKFFLLSTYSGRSLPTLNQMRYESTALSYDDHRIMYPKIITPVFHVRVDQYSLETGDRLSRHLLRVENPGW